MQWTLKWRTGISFGGLHASPDMEREIEILSVASPSLASAEENAGPVLPELAAPQGLIGSAH